MVTLQITKEVNNMKKLTLKDLKVGDKVAVHSLKHLGLVGEVATFPGYKHCPHIGVRFYSEPEISEVKAVLIKDCTLLDIPTLLR